MVLAQALQLTVLGMGMTFASIGALALGMLVITRATRDKDVAGAPAGADSKTTEIAERAETGELPDMGATAAAAAVAVALASSSIDSRAAQAAAAAVAVSLAGSGSSTPQVQAPEAVAWDSYIRSVQLSRRSSYDARRVRG